MFPLRAALFSFYGQGEAARELSLFGHRSFRFSTPLESRRHSPITRGVSVHSCIVPSLGEVGDSAGKGDGTVSRLPSVLCSLSPRVGPRWRAGLSNSQKEAELTRADQLVQIPPSSTLLPQFSLFCVFFSSLPCALRVSFRAAAAERKWWWHRQLRAPTPSCPSLSQKQSEAICSASDIGCGVCRSAPFQE